MSGRCLIWSPLTVRGCRLSVVAVAEVGLHFSCPKMSDRLLHQNEAEQLVLERGLVVAEPDVPFFRFSRDLWNPGYPRLKSMDTSFVQISCGKTVSTQAGERE